VYPIEDTLQKAAMALCSPGPSRRTNVGRAGDDFSGDTLAAQFQWTGSTFTSEQDFGADTNEDRTAAAGTLNDV
jgi:hypothetical protein